MPGRGPQSFTKRPTEHQRKERPHEKMAKRLAKKDAPRTPSDSEDEFAHTGENDGPFGGESEDRESDS